jgi:hypothetical protein
MAIWDKIFNAIRQDDEEEKRRSREGGLGNRLLGFVDDALDVGEGVSNFTESVIQGTGRGVVSLGKSVRDFQQDSRADAQIKSLEEFQQLSYEERKKKAAENEGFKIGLEKIGITDPTDKAIDKRKEELIKKKDNNSVYTPSKATEELIGKGPVKSLQERRRGTQESLEDSRFKGVATPLSILGTGVGAILDVPSPGSVGKGFGKEALEKLAKEGGEQGVKTLLKGKLADDVIERVAPTVAKLGNTKDIKVVLDQAMPSIKGAAANAVLRRDPLGKTLKKIGGTSDEFVDAARVGSVAESAGARPYAAIQQQIETAYNAGDTARVDELVKSIPESARAGIDPRPQTGMKAVYDAATKKTIMKPADDFVDAIAPKAMDVLPPGQRQRGLLKTTQASEQLTDTTKAAIGDINPQGYTPMKIDPTLQAATERVKTDFGNIKNSTFEAMDAGKWDSETSSNAIALLRDANIRQDDELVDELMKRASKQGTDSGQANVLWRTFVNENTPEGMVRFAQKTIERANKDMGFLTKNISRRGKGAYTLSEASEKTIRETMGQANKLADGPEKDELMKTIMRTIHDEIPPGATDYLEAYRYQNMLSGPRTQARNTIGNMIQAGVTMPLTKLYRGGIDMVESALTGKQRESYIKEVPEYYKGMFKGFGDAIEEFKKGWAGDIQQPDLKNLRAYQNEKIPKALTVVGRAMEAQDRFFQSLVRNAEYAAQKSKGATDEVAEQAAGKLSKYAVFRQATDAKNATGQGTLLSNIDKVTDTITNIGKNHKAFRWFVPFIQTPANITKQMIEYSPAGVLTLKGASSAAKRDQLAKTALGTTMTGIGAMFALQGNTTWAPPTDKAEKEAFYSSGKKPYSVKIGDTWVPMISFGPLGYSLGIPAAIKDANDRGEVDDGALDKMADVIAGQAQFFTSQTYLQGVSNFVNAMTGQGNTGDMGKDLAAAGASAAGQLIPLQALSRYVNSAIDPVVRKKKGAADTFISDIPIVGAQYGKDNIEANTNVFTGEEMKRNASDYVAPYSMGKDAANPDDAKFQEGVTEFYKTRGKVSSKKTEANDYIDQALARGDIEEAQNAALDYNDWLAEQFTPWNEKYGGQVSDDLIDSYVKLKISTTGLSRREKNIRKKEEDSTINYR